MKKIASLSILLVLSFVLAACGKTTPATTSETASDGKMFALEICNNYVSVMTCVIGKSPVQIQAQTQKSLDQVLDLWKTLSPDQLENACTETMKTLDTQKTAIQDMGCNL